MSSFRDQTLMQYIDAAQSNAPTPGGGSVAALVGALGSCMASMAANFTAGKKKYAAVEDEVCATLDALAAAREELLRGMDEDAVAFAAIGSAYGMPKETDEEKTARKEAIQSALRSAMAVPVEVIRSAACALGGLPRLAAIGNPNLVSDTGVAAILLEACVRAARLNVLINASSLTDKALAEKTMNEVDALAANAATVMAETLQRVELTIRGGE